MGNGRERCKRDIHGEKGVAALSLMDTRNERIKYNSVQ